MFATYHMTNPAVFYNKEDQWEVPAIDTPAARRSAMEPYYTIMKLPGETERRVHPDAAVHAARSKDNLAAWMVARSDGEHYGKLRGLPVPEAEADLRAAAGGRRASTRTR